MMSKLLFQSSTVYLSLSPGVLSIVVLAVNLPFPTFVSSFRVTEVIEGFVYFRFLSLRPLFRLFDKFETCFFRYFDYLFFLFAYTSTGAFSKSACVSSVYRVILFAFASLFHLFIRWMMNMQRCVSCLMSLFASLFFSENHENPRKKEEI